MPTHRPAEAAATLKVNDNIQDDNDNGSPSSLPSRTPRRFRHLTIMITAEVVNEDDKNLPFGAVIDIRGQVECLEPRRSARKNRIRTEFEPNSLTIRGRRRTQPESRRSCENEGYGI